MKINQTPFNKIPLALAMMIIATGQVGVSIYLPSLPLISRDLGVPQADIQQLVTLFLVGFGLSQLFYGPLSDAIGRRPVFLLGQGIYLVGTLICVLLPDSYTALITGRLLQGLGAGSASVLSRSVLRDSYSGSQLTQAMSYMSITASILPILAPVVGGWAAWHFGWQSVFIFVLLYLSAIVTLGYFVLPETLPHAVTKFKIRKTLRGYWHLSQNYQVISSASYNWVGYLSTLVSVSLLPFLLQEGLKLSPAEYGEVMIIPSTGLLMGCLILNKLNKRFTTNQLIYLASSIMMMAGCWLVFNEMSLPNLIFGFTLLSIAQGICFPLSMSMLLAPHSKQVGAVSALSGSVQMCIAGLLGGFLIKHLINSQTSLGVFYLLTGLTIALILTHSRHRHLNQSYLPLNSHDSK
ncbi:multidrug effflux MFS transporter [Moritella sp. 5]|uniref:multidrug effflux MFS transporter n=1 Tax=Moritella sp. 5 TaxID=2746231 RepID=UPI001BAC838F|nr:multidrug effflux MFS transporter [Moritella sp. 5]QUM80327.1 multidrug effflux MFS transporter [Moritella sp. 5]